MKTFLKFKNSQQWEFDRPFLMGVINLTPDSFFDGGKCDEMTFFKKKVKDMKNARVNIIDLGGESTRPGSNPITAEKELSRLLPALEWIKNNYPEIPVSIDTYKIKVAETCIKMGADLINDISAGDASNNEIFSLCAEQQTPLILMHKQGDPKTMQEDFFYQNIVEEVYSYLEKKIDLAHQRGLEKNQIMIDVGIGFGKNLQHNLSLLKALPHFKKLGVGVLVGASRKRMLGEITNREVEKRLAGSLSVHLAALVNQCNMVRCHDIVEMRDAIEVYFSVKDYSY